jgi:hypothetical protein
MVNAFNASQANFVSTQWNVGGALAALLLCFMHLFVVLIQCRLLYRHKFQAHVCSKMEPL